MVEQLEDRIALSHTPLNPNMEFQVNENAAAPFEIPDLGFIPVDVAVATDADGDFVVAWSSSEPNGQANLFFRLFDENGNPNPASPNQLSVTGPFNNGQEPVTFDVAMDADGDFVIVFEAVDRNGDSAVFFQQFDATGNPDPAGATRIAPDPALDPQFLRTFDPSVGIDDNGNFVVAFLATSDSADDLEVFFQQFDATGAPIGTSVQISDELVGNDPIFSRPDIDSDANGNFIVTWTTKQGADLRIVAQGFNADQSPAFGPIDVTLVIAGFDPGIPSVAIAEDGTSFVIGWTRNDTSTIEARRFDASGNDPVENPGVFTVNTAPIVGAISDTAVASDADGNFVITWSTGAIGNRQGGQVFARTFNANGTPEQEAGDDPLIANVITTDFGRNAVAMNRDGDFISVWVGTEIQNNPPPAPGPILLSIGDNPNFNRPPIQLPNDDIFARIFRAPDRPDIPPPDDDPDPVIPDPVPPAQAPDPIPLPLPIPIPLPPTINPLDPAVLIALARAQAEQRDASIILTSLASENDNPLSFQPLVPPSGPTTDVPLLSTNIGGSEGVGEISGRIFADLNGNGIQDATEPGLAGQLVFLDINKNGAWDKGEPLLETNEKGDYLFARLRLDDYIVWQDLSTLRFQQTLPQEDKRHTVKLRYDHQAQANVNFGAMDRIGAVSNPNVPKAPETIRKPSDGITPGIEEEQNKPSKKQPPKKE